MRNDVGLTYWPDGEKKKVGGAHARVLAVVMFLIYNFSSFISTQAQGFGNVNLPSVVCAGTVMSISVGHNPDFNVAVDLPDSCSLDSCYITGVDVMGWSDSVFRVGWMTNISHDSTVSLTIVINTSCGDTFDTTVSFLLHPTHIHTVQMSGRCPVVWNDKVLTHDTTIVQHLYAMTGCDSLVEQVFTVIQPTAELSDTFCFGQTYSWHGLTAGVQTSYITLNYSLTDTITTEHGCDSAVTMNLVQLGKPRVRLSYETDCAAGQYVLMPQVNYTNGMKPFLRWSTTAVDTLLPGHELDGVVPVMPQGEDYGVYYLYVDYREQPQCPYVDSLRLNPMVVPKATMRVTPENVKYDHRDFDAQDITVELPYSSSPDSLTAWTREWFIDGEFIAAGTRYLHYEAVGPWPDSVMVSLHIFNGVCHDTVSTSVNYVRREMWAPNVFTPDREDNNRFAVVGIGLLEGKLYVYNREGVLVFSTENYTEGWDGRDYAGRPCVQGNYMWSLIYRAEDYPGVTRNRAGSVLLLR